MKLGVFLIAVLAVAGHHGANAQCQCDCTCPSTEQTTCNPETTTELTTSTTSTSTTTTTPSTSTSSTSSTTSTSTTSTSTTSTSTTSTSTTSTSTTSTSTTSTSTTSTSTTSTSTTSTSTTSTTTTSTTTTSTSTTSTSTTSTTSTSTTSTSTTSTSTSTTTSSTTSTSTSTTTTSSSTTSTSTTTTTPMPTTTTTTSTTVKPTTTTTVVPTSTPIPPFDCGEFTVDVGKQVPMQSENYPENYKKKSKCTWELTCSDPNGVWSVSCDDFKTEEAAECSDADYVKIKDGTGAKLGEFCGTDGPDLTTSDDYLKFVFKTDKDSIKERGFSCTAVCSVPDETTTTTTVAPSTETPAGGYSGVCSLEWTAVSGESVIWESPNYDGLEGKYPEGDYCCWLNVTIPSTYLLFMVTMEMDDNSKIFETSSCTGDKITYMSSAGTYTTICGNLGGQKWTETAMFNTPLSFGFQWCSDETDGGRDIGFQMTISGLDLLGRK